MIRKSLRFLGLAALMLPLAVGVGVMAGEDCHKDKAAKAVHAEGKGVHCHLGMSKNIAKTARMTEDGAVVTMEGKTDEAAQFVKQHLSRHEKGTGCAGCPMEMDDVTSSVSLTDKGGEITLVGSSPEAIKKVQAWAEKPAACCEGKTEA